MPRRHLLGRAALDGCADQTTRAPSAARGHRGTRECATADALAPSGVAVGFARGAPTAGADNRTLIAAAVALAARSDAAVLVLGDDLATCGEWGDRDSLELPGAQLPLLEAVAATGTPTIVVHVGGRTASFGGPANAVLANVSALVAAFRPGMFGARALAW